MYILITLYMLVYIPYIPYIYIDILGLAPIRSMETIF